jgi:gamma-glutamyltranspeptidase/glutathione hydrolase
MRRPKSTLIIALFLLLAGAITGLSAYRAPVWSRSGMAATPHPVATDAAVEILKAGGNAVDAALAAAFALSVVEPYHSGLGGGEFAVIWKVADGQAAALDARECAPAAATSDMFLDKTTGKADENESWRGGLAVGVPGSVAGRVELHRTYGRLPLSDVVAPAVRLARDGFIIDRYLADRIQGSRDALAESGAGVVFMPHGTPLQRGDVLVQPALAAALERIANDRGASFHTGADGQAIVRDCRKAGGILTVDDLAHYRAVWREPVRFSYRGLDVISMPPPSSGGVCLAEILNILEGFPLSYLEPGGSEAYHLLASSFEAAFADRAAWLGDPDFVPQPISGMTSRKYAAKLREPINRQIHNPVASAGEPWPFENDANTSHISVIDRNGNMCALTTSVNTAFGSLVYVPELGIFLNSTMDDFAKGPKDPNEWGLVGGDANRIAPGKRPLSSMCPTIILKNGKSYLCIGSVGGPRIISSVVQIIVNVVDFKMDVQAAIDAPRIHYQWRPDKLYCEKEIPPEVVRELTVKRWDVEHGGNWSLSQGVEFNAETGCFYGASDARGVGTAAPAEAP